MPYGDPPVTEQPDDRSPLARATQWSVSTMTIAVEMVVPILLGAWIDGRLGTKGVFAIIGGTIGLAAGIWSLLRLVEPLRHDRQRTADRQEHPHQPPP